MDTVRSAELSSEVVGQDWRWVCRGGGNVCAGFES